MDAQTISDQPQRLSIGEWIDRAVALVPAQQCSPAGWVFRYAMTPAIVAAALVMRELIGPPELGLPFLTFFPAVVLAAAIGGVIPGALAALLSAAFATFLYLPPYHALSFDFAPETVWSNVVFLGGSAVVCFAIYAMHRQYHNFRSADGNYRQEHQLLQTIVEGTTDAIFVKDPQGRYRLVNGAAARFVGKAANEIIGRDDLQVFAPDDARAIMACDRAVMESRKVTTYEDRITTRDGKRVFLATKGPLFDAFGNVTGIFGISRDITLIKKAEDVSRARLATHDELTGMPNRTLFHDQLLLAVAHAEHVGSQFAVLCVDLDDFKFINDTLGHETGDRLLVQAAERLRACMGADGSIARMGGDEFAILVDATDKQTAALAAERLLDFLSDAYRIDGRECFASASIGISFFPDDADEQSALLRHAETAMYRAKQQGKNSYQFFSQEMAVRMHQRLSIEQGLRDAIEQRELFIEYQPQVDLRQHRLVGAEALVRWRRDGSVMPPLSFIPIAEETGLIADIGEWVVGEACRQIKRWDEDGLPRFNVSVNISARHFRQAGMVARLKAIVGGAGLDPHRLCLEITEGALEDVASATAMLEELQALGFGISIDDFGTGFSSLSHLKRFAIHELKVDRSFVDGIVEDRDDRAIAAAIIGMARSLGLRVVAEGVENAAQLDELQSLGCDIGQGYFYARPMPAAAFAEWTRHHAEKPAAILESSTT